MGMMGLIDSIFSFILIHLGEGCSKAETSVRPGQGSTVGDAGKSMEDVL